MSLINQVLRDLDTREPLQDKPANVSAAAAPPPRSKTSPDWVRLLVWTVTGLLVLAFLAYTLLFEANPPETSVVQPVAVNNNVQTVEAKTQPVESREGAQTERESVNPTDMDKPEESAVAESKAFEDRQPVVAAASTDEPLQQEKTQQAETEKQVAYLPLHDDGQVITVKQPAPAARQEMQKQSETEIVVTRAVRSPLVVAREMIAQGRLTEAEVKLREIVESKPADINARELLVGLLLRNKRTAEAGQQIQLGQKYHPQRENLVLLQARTLLDEQKTAEAMAVLENQIRARKAGSKTLAMLAPLYQQQSRFEDSARLYEKLIQQQPAQAPYWLGLALNLEALARSTEAVNAYKRALKADGLSFSLQQYAMQRINHFSQLSTSNE